MNHENREWKKMLKYDGNIFEILCYDFFFLLCCIYLMHNPNKLKNPGLTFGGFVQSILRENLMSCSWFNRFRSIYWTKMYGFKLKSSKRKTRDESETVCNFFLLSLPQSVLTFKCPPKAELSTGGWILQYFVCVTTAGAEMLPLPPPAPPPWLTFHI